MSLSSRAAVPIPAVGVAAVECVFKLTQDQRGELVSLVLVYRVTGGELFEDIVAREYYSEADAR